MQIEQSPQETLQRLVDNDIVDLSSDGQEVHLSSQFTSQVSEIEAHLEDGTDQTLEDRLDRLQIDRAEVDHLLGIADRHQTFLATYLALGGNIPDSTHEDRIRLSIALTQLSSEDLRDEGAPLSFITVDAHLLMTLMDLYEKVIVYCWRDECSPCDEMVDQLDTVFDQGAPDDTILLAIYGPADSTFLHDRFGIDGSPTTLFIENGEVESRLVGLHYETVLETEVERLCG